IQSNFMRMAASCARALGMETVAQLEERMDQADARYLSSGNVFLSQILGAELVSAPDADNEVTADASLRTMAEKLRGGGRVPYVIGTSPQYTPLGALGYVRAAEEILSQGYDFDLFVVASGSGNTHAGLLAGLRAFGSSAQVVGSCVSRPVAEQEIRLGQTLRGLEGFLGEAYSVTPEDVFLWDGALAPGYGKTGPAAIEAMRLAADEEGLLLDPVYTSKAFAMIPVLVADGTIPMGSRVCFIHTGGLASLFGYEPTLRPSLLKG
ncbi:MAG: pyridoxal-phosphate dependent enzyme, partial [Pseudomonadota bacterium]